MAVYEHHTHNFLPVYNKYSKVLILGNFPSVKSREQQFYYSRLQNLLGKSSLSLRVLLC